MLLWNGEKPYCVRCAPRSPVFAPGPVAVYTVAVSEPELFYDEQLDKCVMGFLIQTPLAVSSRWSGAVPIVNPASFPDPRCQPAALMDTGTLHLPSRADGARPAPAPEPPGQPGGSTVSKAATGPLGSRWAKLPCDQELMKSKMGGYEIPPNMIPAPWSSKKRPEVEEKCGEERELHIGENPPR